MEAKLDLGTLPLAATAEILSHTAEPGNTFPWAAKSDPQAQISHSTFCQIFVTVRKNSRFYYLIVKLEELKLAKSELW